jgi:uncharacterized membrane protein
MAGDWKLEGLERRVERLEKRVDEKERKSRERSTFWFQAVMWTVMVVYVTALVVLAITHNLHNH